jgi:acyl-CoA synthetase (AMP-forming)/AMP-acid ligase II
MAEEPPRESQDLAGITKDAGPVLEKAECFDPASQKFCPDFVDGDWKSYYDFIPDKDEPFLFGNPGDTRKPLSFKALKEFISREDLNIPGLAREDRLCTAFVSGAELGVFFLTYALRCTFAPLNMMLRADEFEFEFDDLPAKGLVVQSKDSLKGEEEEKAVGTAIAAARRKKLQIIMQVVPDKEVIGLFSIEKHAAGKPLKGATIGPPLDSISRDQIALVLHTSGTTKKPKIVPITHGSIAIGAKCHQCADLLDESDVFVNFMPMFHIAGLVENMLTAVVSGAKFVALRGQYKPFEFYNALHAEPFPTAYSAVPVHNLTLIQWAQEMEKAEGKPFENSVKYIRNDSAALVPSLAVQMEEYIKATVAPAYSMTESNPIASNPRYGVRKLKSVGPSVGPELVLLQGYPSTNRIATPGEEGEVAVKGECVMKGYEMRDHMEKDPNIETFSDGFMRSGDKGWVDADGYLYLIGRFKELINRSGEKISPFEVEDAVRKHDAVKDCLCFAAPHSMLGESVGVVVTVQDDKKVGIGELREWLTARNNLAHMWCPEVLVIMPAIPKGPTGKPARINLAKRLELETLTGEVKEIEHPGL